MYVNIDSKFIPVESEQLVRNGNQRRNLRRNLYQLFIKVYI